MQSDCREEQTGRDRKRFQYRLRTLLLLPLVVAGVGAVGVWGGWTAVLLVMPPMVGIVLVRSRIATWGVSVIVVVYLYGLLAALLPTLERARVIGRPIIRCENNLKQIVLSLHTYRGTYGVFPPAYIADETGRPIHSWRVLLLPFLEKKALYDKYRFDEPWDGPNNRMLATAIVSVYNCPDDPSCPSANTSYFLVTGEGSAWCEDRAPDIPDFSDGLSSTIAVVEVAGSGIHWMEPRDLDISDAMLGINTSTGAGIWSNHPRGAWVAFADGSVHFLPDNTSAKSLKDLVTQEVARP